MTVQEVAKSVMKVTGMTQKKVSDAAGLSGQAAVSMFLKSKNMRVDSLLMILNACGYELVVRDPRGRYPEMVIGEEQKTATEEERIQALVRKMVEEELRKSH